MVSGHSDLKQLFYIKWFHSAPESVRLFGESFLPPLIIILINQVLLYIIYILGKSRLTKQTWKAIIDILSTKALY